MTEALVFIGAALYLLVRLRESAIKERARLRAAHIGEWRGDAATRWTRLHYAGRMAGSWGLTLGGGLFLLASIYFAGDYAGIWRGQ